MGNNSSIALFHNTEVKLKLQRLTTEIHPSGVYPQCLDSAVCVQL